MMTIRKTLGFSVFGFSLLLSSIAQATPLYLKGDVIYRERMALPEGAKVEVSLLDVSRADAPSIALGQTQFAPAHSSPIPFEIQFDSSDIKTGHRYVLQARIEHEDKLLFTTTENFPVFSGDKNDTQVFVERVSQPDHGNAAVDSDAVSGDWILKAVEGKKVEGTNDNFIFHFDDKNRLGATVGCNHFGGGFKIKNTQIEFSQMMSTSMACDEVVMRREEKVIQNFAQIKNFTIKDNQLEFKDNQGKSLLLLERKK